MTMIERFEAAAIDWNKCSTSHKKFKLLYLDPGGIR
jgi:hypothetical protein